MGEMVEREDPRDITIAGFTLTSVGVLVDGEPTLDEWRGAMQFVERCATGVMWWWGDLLNHGYAHYGELASQEEGDGKPKYQTLRHAKHVSCQVPLFIRMHTLAWGHHQVVAPLNHDEQRHWLQLAEDNKWSVGRLRTETANARAVKRLLETPMPVGKWHVIYADPPWRYDFAQSDTRKIENQYPTMSIEQIKELKVPSAEDSVLFIWATSPKLDESIEVLEEWGYDYKTCMVWVKDKIGMGYYARQQHELLLIGSKGSLGETPADKRPPSVIHAPRDEHSRKPDRFYEIIEGLYPEQKKLELFQRRDRSGWTGWGDQAPQL